MTAPNGHANGSAKGGARVRLDLSVLRPEIGDFQLVPGGAWHTLTSPSILQLELVEGYGEKTTKEQVQMAKALLAVCMPDVTPEEWREVGPRQLVALMELAVDPAAAVKKYQEEIEPDADPNGQRETISQPATSPLTPSATSATASPWPPAGVSGTS
jgi:hypothetical protein